MRGIVIGVLLLLSLLGSTPVGPFSAWGASSPDLSLAIGQDSVSVSLSLRTFQNFTLLEPIYTLPQTHSVLEGANSTQLLAGLQASIQLKTPTAEVRNPRLEIVSGSWSNQTGRQWLNVSLTFNVAGVQTEDSGRVSVDLSWKSFRVESDIDAGGFEANNIGPRYLVDIARDIVASQPPTSEFVTIVYVADSHQVVATRFPVQVTRIATLNFTRLTAPISQWESPFAPLSQTKTWTFQGPQLGMSITRIIREPELDAGISYGLFYTYRAEVTAPFSSSANGDTVTFADVSELPEALMGLTIVAAIATGSGTFLFERRVLGGKIRKKTKR